MFVVPMLHMGLIYMRRLNAVIAARVGRFRRRLAVCGRLAPCATRGWAGGVRSRGVPLRNAVCAAGELFSPRASRETAFLIGTRRGWRVRCPHVAHGADLHATAKRRLCGGVRGGLFVDPTLHVGLIYMRRLNAVFAARVAAIIRCPHVAHGADLRDG